MTIFQPKTKCPTRTHHKPPRRNLTRWLADLFLAFRRRVSQILIPLVLLAAITAIVVSLGSGLLLLGKTELELGPIALAWAVVAAALAVLLIGLSALWLAARAGRSTPSHR